MKTTLAMVLLAIFVIGGLSILDHSAQGSSPTRIVLTEANTVVLRSPIFTETVAPLEIQLLSENAKLAQGIPIFLVLDSPGGDIEAGMRFIETAKGLGRPVHTVSMFSASMSFIISQYLGQRLVLDSSTLMSHHPSGGVAGQFPGNLVTRFKAMYTEALRIDAHIADRAGISLDSYEALVSNELWLNGPDAVTEGFADEVVSLTCDLSMQGAAEPTQIQTMFGAVTVVFDKCPLVTQPLSVKGDASMVDLLQGYYRNRAQYASERTFEGGR